MQLQSLFYSALSYIILNFTCQDIAASLILLLHFFISSAHLHGVVRFYSALNRCFPFCILSLERRVWVWDYPRSQDYWLQFLIALHFVKTKNALLHIDWTECWALWRRTRSTSLHGTVDSLHIIFVPERVFVSPVIQSSSPVHWTVTADCA